MLSLPEIQGVIKELEAANEAAEKSRARFHKIQTARSDVINESLKASAKYWEGERKKWLRRIRKWVCCREKREILGINGKK